MKTLLEKDPDHFLQVPAGSRADDFLLYMADEHPGARILSNDRYNRSCKTLSVDPLFGSSDSRHDFESPYFLPESFSVDSVEVRKEIGRIESGEFAGTEFHLKMER